jgi:hypothetical protein
MFNRSTFCLNACNSSSLLSECMLLLEEFCDMADVTQYTRVILKCETIQLSFKIFCCFLQK